MTYGSMEEGSERFHQATHNGTQFETYDLFISEIFHLIFSS